MLFSGHKFWVQGIIGTCIPGFARKFLPSLIVLGAGHSQFKIWSLIFPLLWTPSILHMSFDKVDVIYENNDMNRLNINYV